MRVRAILSAITAGTPQNIAAAFGYDTDKPLLANRMFIQPQHGATVGLVYVLENPRRGAVLAVSTDLIAEIQAATSASPGGNYDDFYPKNDSGGIDLTLMAIDVATTNTPVLVTADINV